MKKQHIIEKWTKKQDVLAIEIKFSNNKVEKASKMKLILQIDEFIFDLKLIKEKEDDKQELEGAIDARNKI